MLESNEGQVKMTIVEQDTNLKGALVSNCPVVVRGKLEGEMTAPSLSVSATGAVHGVVKVGEIESEGELSGEFEADLVRLSGVVKDKTVVRARSLEVKLASSDGKIGVLLGDCAFEVGDMPDKQAAIRAALEHGSPAEAVAAPPEPEAVPGISAPKDTAEATRRRPHRRRRKATALAC
jgi:cytoskeletal protein CcmA (bactofilin family)